MCSLLSDGKSYIADLKHVIAGIEQGTIYTAAQPQVSILRTECQCALHHHPWNIIIRFTGGTSALGFPLGSRDKNLLVPVARAGEGGP